MNNYKVLIEYDGARYNGWQKQGNTQNTIQGKIENVLKEMTGKPVLVNGSGRTDAGVHAKCQVANFKCETNLSETEIKDYLNHYLPDDIKIIYIEPADDRFHARLNAKEKIYSYVISISDKTSVFERKYCCHIKENLDVGKMVEASKFLLGTHDFKAFCSNSHIKKSTVRKIYSIDFLKTEDKIEILYKGNGFLYNMVRIMTGTLIEVGLGKKQPEDIINIIASKNRECAGYTAPPQGLFLEKVVY